MISGMAQERPLWMRFCAISPNGQISVGNNANITPYMLRSTLSVPCACGESDTINFPIILN